MGKHCLRNWRQIFKSSKSLLSTIAPYVQSGLGLFLPGAERQVYEHIFNVFLQIKNKTFEKLPMADNQVYERTVEVFLKFYANKKWKIAYFLRHEPSLKNAKNYAATGYDQ